MRKIIQLGSLCFLGLISTQMVFAHAVWIESNGKATKNQPQEVKVFYGEFPEGVPDSTAKWYSDVKELEVFVVSPGGKKTKLTLTDAITCLKGSFIPEQEGLYYISTVHAARELGGTTKYEFQSIKPVQVGSMKAADRLPEVSLAILTDPAGYKMNEEIELTVLKNGIPYEGGEVQVMSAEGWVKTLKADKWGKVRFKPVLKGAYVIETSSYAKEAGEWNQKTYTHAWCGATTHLLVK